MSSMWRLGRWSGDSGAGCDARLGDETSGGGNSSSEAAANVTMANIFLCAKCQYHYVCIINSPTIEQTYKAYDFMEWKNNQTMTTSLMLL